MDYLPASTMQEKSEMEEMRLLDIISACNSSSNKLLVLYLVKHRYIGIFFQYRTELEKWLGCM